jgi:hypothetical protein
MGPQPSCKLSKQESSECRLASQVRLPSFTFYVQPKISVSHCRADMMPCSVGCCALSPDHALTCNTACCAKAFWLATWQVSLQLVCLPRHEAIRQSGLRSSVVGLPAGCSQSKSSSGWGCSGRKLYMQWWMVDQGPCPHFQTHMNNVHAGRLLQALHAPDCTQFYHNWPIL